MSSTHTTITAWFQEAEQRFSNTDLPSPRLDAELLLAHALEVDRTWLHAHGDEVLTAQQLTKLEHLITRRLNREPIAYITGRKEFYGREFIVTPDVLIPRPESETMIDLLKSLHPAILAKTPRSKEQIFLIDVGTGSGCLGITAKLELPELNVTLSDVSRTALTIARENAERFRADVRLLESYLLSNLQPLASSVHCILANLPYVDESWERSPETDHEPALALFAEQRGLELIYKLLDQTPKVLASGGYILLEADPEQHAAIIRRGQQNGLRLEAIRDYIVILQKP
ncbi:peptide chain release factor N(5)-glutamine methyltransferase [Candidatus Saccharibacteria bacterium]|nr:MAG: peptide chain release factor N(5)-glutamine methyltransferase [Candidatus Saccharibacteria bacterium]